MPTFRLGLYNHIPFSPFSGFDFDITIFSKFLVDDNIIFLFKPHPYDANLPDFNETERFIYLKNNEYDDLYEFIGNIDILATDYSSVYFDFLLTNKPVILTPFDYEEYIKTRGLFFDYKKYIDGAKAYNWNDFIEIVKQNKYFSVHDTNVFNSYKDQNSCKRVFDTINERFKVI
jgi:CDP-glycerol glycerophosphotransferase